MRSIMPTGLHGKLLLLFTLLTVSAVVISSGHARYQQRLFVLERAQERAAEDLRLISGDIQTILTWVLRDLLVLRDLPQLQRLLEAESETERQAALRDVEKAFLSLTDHHRIFHQVRFLDATGQEKVRINAYHGQAGVVPIPELQDKSSRYYFQNAIRLAPGQVYVSQLDLNIEQGEIERPFVPTIRYATPVVDRRGKKRGVIVINVLGSAILHQLDIRQQSSKHGERFHLLNQEGFYLYHSDPARTFGFMLGTGHTIGRDEPEMAGQIMKNSEGLHIHPSARTGKESLFAFQRIHVAPVTLPGNAPNDPAPQVAGAGTTGDHWILLAAVDDAELLVGFGKYIRSFLPFTILLLIACIIAASLVAWNCSRPVISLAQAARRIQEGDLTARAMVYTKDEMGRLGQLFNGMAAKLENSISRLRHSEAKYRRLFENSRDCIFVTSLDCALIDLNHAGRELLGLTSSDALGRLSLDCCQPRTDAADAGSFLESALQKEGYVQELETLLRRPDDSLRTCLLTATGRRDESGRLTGYDGILRDITEKRQQEKAKRDFQQRLQEEIILAEERERQHLGQVLHEEMAQNLAMVNMQIQKAEQTLCRRQPVGKEAPVCVSRELAGVRDLLRGMIQQIRSMVFDLYPAILESQGLAATIHWYCDNFSRRTGIAVTIRDSQSLPCLSLPRQIYLFRACKELLHNAWKHAGAREIVVSIMARDNHLRLIVDDAGQGFDPAEKLGPGKSIRGIGLLSIRQWATSMDGGLTVESQPGKGTRVVIEVPLEENKSGEERG